MILRDIFQVKLKSNQSSSQWLNRVKCYCQYQYESAKRIKLITIKTQKELAFTAKKTTLIPYRPISLFQFNKTCLNIFYKIISIEITPLHCNTLVAKLKYGAIHKGCPHIREREREGADKSGQMKTGGGGLVS